jgi:hypothetical protein
MEIEGRGAAPDRAERRAGPHEAPYVAAIELTAKEKSRPAIAYAPWIKSISSYERKETTVVEGLRYG